MDYTLYQVRGYIRASERLQAEAMVRESIAVRVAQADDKTWAEWSRKVIG